MGWADAAADARALARGRRRHLPHARRRRERDRVARRPQALPRRHPAPEPGDPGRRRPGPGAPGPHGPARAAGGALGGRSGGALGRADVRHMAAAQRRDAWRTDPVRDRRRSCVGAGALRSQFAARALLHPLGRRLRFAHRHQWRRPAGPLRRGLAARRAAGGRGARRRAPRPGGSGAPDRARRRRRQRGRRRGRGARAPRDRRAAARAGGPHRVRPAAARPPRPAHPAHGPGHGHQVHGDLPRAILARRGPDRSGARATSGRCA